MAVSPDGKTLYVSDKTAGCVAVLDAAAGKKVREVAIAGEPNGLALSADGKTLYVAQRKANSIAVVDTVQGAVTGEIPVGTWPVALALAENTQRLYCCNRGNHTVSVVDLAAAKEIRQIAVVRDPAFAAITPDESRVVVANFMPHGAGTDPELAAEVSILDTAAMQQVARVKLPPGSTMAGGVWIDPDGQVGLRGSHPRPLQPSDHATGTGLGPYLRLEHHRRGGGYTVGDRAVGRSDQGRGRSLGRGRLGRRQDALDQPPRRPRGLDARRRSHPRTARQVTCRTRWPN